MIKIGKIQLILIISLIFITIISMTSIVKSNIIIISNNENIQTIINNINENDTIHLKPGIYNQTFIIDKKISIIGDNPNNTIIKVKTLRNKAAIIIKSSYVTISNITIQNDAEGIYSSALKIITANNNIKNCIIQNTPIGISIFNSNNRISNTTFNRCSDEGILLISTLIMKSYYNIIDNCTFFSNCDAIEMQKSCYNTIKNCLIKNNSHSGIDAINQDNNHNIIKNCTISNNNVHGIYLSKSINNSISNCKMYLNAEADIIDTNSMNINSLFDTENINNIFNKISNNSFISNIIAHINKIFERIQSIKLNKINN